MSRNPLQTFPFDGTQYAPGAEARPAGKPAGGFRRQSDTGNVSGKKFQRERKTAPKPPRKRFCTGIFSYEPRKKNSKPRKKIPGLGISRSGPKISRQTVQKVKDADKNLHKNPVLCKKIARKSAIWAGLRKSRVTKIIQNGTICLFSQAFYDILIFQKHVFLVDERDGCVLFPVLCGLYHLIDGAVSLFAVIAFFASGMCLPRRCFLF